MRIREREDNSRLPNDYLSDERERDSGRVRVAIVVANQPESALDKTTKDFLNFKLTLGASNCLILWSLSPRSSREDSPKGAVSAKTSEETFLKRVKKKVKRPLNALKSAAGLGQKVRERGVSPTTRGSSRQHSLMREGRLHKLLWSVKIFEIAMNMYSPKTLKFLILSNFLRQKFSKYDRLRNALKWQSRVAVGDTGQAKLWTACTAQRLCYVS